MYDLGDVVPLTVTVRNAAGTPEDATAVTLSVTLPDDTTETPSVTSEGAGVYSCDYAPSTAGRYVYTWTATGTNAAAFGPDIFDVRSATTVNILSLADAKAALNMTAATNDEELRGYIEAATSLIEAHIGPVVPRTVTETVEARRRLILTGSPIVSVTSIVGVYPDAPVVDVIDLAVDAATGVISYLARSDFVAGAYTVTYIAGRTGPIAPHITQAAKVLVQHLWRTQRGSSSRPRGDDGIDAFGQGYAMPNRVLELLQSELKAPGIA